MNTEAVAKDTVTALKLLEKALTLYECFMESVNKTTIQKYDYNPHMDIDVCETVNKLRSCILSYAYCMKVALNEADKEFEMHKSKE